MWSLDTSKGLLYLVTIIHLTNYGFCAFVTFEENHDRFNKLAIYLG